MTNSKKTQRLVALLLVLSLLIPLINYYKQSVKADSTKTTTTTTSSTIGEISATDEVELVEDFTNSPVLKYVNTESFAKNNHVKRLRDEEELNTYMFKNADGTKTMYMMYENVKYIDKFGNVKDKDISLKLDNNVYKVTDNNVALSIPTTPQNGIEVNYDNNIVKITPVRNLTASKIVTTMENNAVTYKNYYGTGIDLRYTPLLSGVKEDIILSEYAQQTYTFTLETNGLNIYEKEGRYYLAKDEKAESIYDIGEVLVYDAVGRPITGTMLITTKEAGKTYEISISVSDEYLKDATTVYPVTIDPTVTISDNINGAGAIQDAPIFSGLKTTNCGNYTYLSPGYVDSTYKIGRVLVRLPGLYNSWEYRYTTWDNIMSVKFCCKDGSGNAASYVNLYPITSNINWSEMDVTWNTGNNTYLTTQNWGKNVFFGTTTEFDITHLVRNWKLNNYNEVAGFMLVNSNETSAAYRKAIFSSEYGVTTDRPYVIFTYGEPEYFEIATQRKEIALGGYLNLEYYTNVEGGSITLSSSNSNIVRVNSSANMLFGLQNGSAEVIATLTVGEEEYVDRIMVEVVDYTGIRNETNYYLTNKLTRKILAQSIPTIGNVSISSIDISSMNSNTIAGVNNRLSATWEIYMCDDGRYKLLNQYADGLYSLTKVGSALQTTLDNVDENAMFNIARINEGEYKGLYLIIINGQYMTSDLAGNITITSIKTEGSYWSLAQSEYGNAHLNSTYYIGFNANENDGIFTSILNYFDYNATSQTNVGAPSVYNSLLNSQIYAYRGHGIAGGLQLCRYGKTDILGYLLCNEDLSQVYNNSSNKYISDLNNNALASSRCVFYIACETGLDYNYNGNIYNLLEETYNKGAHFVLGTTCYVDTTDSNFYFKTLLENIRDHPDYTMEEHLNVTIEAVRNQILGEFDVIYIGDTLQRLYYGDVMIYEED
ncbi:MAG: hypothetical protein E7252_03310 [Lachnospira sp.]|nr:hypothetical protein [Lachnospira sp.]